MDLPHNPQRDPQQVPGRWEAIDPKLMILPAIAGAPVLLRCITSDAEPARAAGLVTAVIAWAVVAVVAIWIAQVAWRLGGRSRPAGNAVFSALCILWALATWGTAGRDSSVSQAMVRADTVIEQERQLTRSRAALELETQGYVSASTESVGRVLEAMEAASSEMSGHEAGAVRAAAAFLREMGEIGRAIEAASAQLHAAGDGDLAVLTTPAAFDEHERILGELARLNAELIVFVERGPARYRQLLNAEGVPRGMQDHCIRQFNREFKADLLLAVREQDLEVITASRELLTILKRNLGHWEPDSTGMVVFDDAVPDEDVHRFDALTMRIGIAMERLREVQRELFELEGQ